MSRAAWDGIVSRVLAQTGVAESAFYAPGRGTRTVTTARTLAVYLARIELGIRRADVASYVGKSDRHVKRVCVLVEDGRDDSKFEQIVELLSEQVEELKPDVRRTRQLAPRSPIAALAA